MRRETIALHHGYTADGRAPTTAVPIYQSAAYEFESAEHAAALFNLEVDGFRYSRISNPTNDVLEQRVAAMEGGLKALSVASGQAALHFATLNVTSPGTNIVSVPQLYGTTYTLFAHLLPTMGVTVRFAADDSPEAIDALIDDDTRAVYCESVGNPAGNVCDLESLATIAHGHGVPLIVDNTVPTPILLRPIEFGADIVVHSLTKFMGGHGTTMGGIIVDSGKFPWAEHASRFPMFTEPDASYHDLVYTEHFGEAAYIGRCRSVYQRTLGAVLSPLNAFLLLQGIESVALRMERHVENARRVAEFLRDDSRVEWVNYAGFADSPYFPLTQKYLCGRACSIMTFGIRGGLTAGARFYNALELVKRVVNLGDSKSLACHPASTTHRQMTPAEQVKAGVLPEMIRVSIGIEHIDDILEDLDQALDSAAPRATARETMSRGEPSVANTSIR
jgi:O-acetylhomoserine (thiol)-lyase